MCDICTTAKRFPSTQHSLEFLGSQIVALLPKDPPSCVESLIGELVGVPDIEVDKEFERDWERANHGASQAKRRV